MRHNIQHDVEHHTTGYGTVDGEYEVDSTLVEVDSNLLDSRSTTFSIRQNEASITGESTAMISGTTQTNAILNLRDRERERVR